MKIVILAGQNSIHTVRWVNSLSDRNYEIHLITQHPSTEHQLNNSVKVYQLPFRGMLGYFLNVPFLKYFLNQIKPDILHAHYAGGYGVLGYLSNFHPFILSVWGSDVYTTPYNSPLHKILIKNSLRSADRVCSTSRVMGEQVLSLCPDLDPDKLSITPFGIDTNKFICHSKTENSNTITIGTVKTLEHTYGIDILIKSFHRVFCDLQKYSPDIASQLRLLIVGDGSLKPEFQNLAKSLRIDDITEFTGFIRHNKVPQYLNNLDIYVAVSRCESFGVAILEASACALPVIVSNIGGLPEVVIDGETGFIVEKENVEASADAIMKLILDSSLREKMGDNGRRHVCDNYNWEKSVSIMEEVYRKVI